jgi:hypothetical protein
VSKVDLRLDWVGHDAAKFAVEHWHYSHAMPAGKIIRIGAWEDDRFIGVILFGRGANNHIGSPYGLQQTEVCELVRVALHVHVSPVSRIVSIAIKMLKKSNPGLRLLISYADEQAQGHVGGVYQAMNWTYTGTSQAQRELRLAGQVVHKRTGNARYGTIVGIPKSDILWKHKYLYPLDDDMRRQIEPLRRPYPKRLPANEAIQDAPGDQSGMGGASPTRSL